MRYRRRLLGLLVLDAVRRQQLLQLRAGCVQADVEDGYLRFVHRIVVHARV